MDQPSLGRRHPVLFIVGSVVLVEAANLIFLLVALGATSAIPAPAPSLGWADVVRWAFLIILVRLPLSLAWTLSVSLRPFLLYARTGHRERPLNGRLDGWIGRTIDIVETALAAAFVFLTHLSSARDIVILTVISTTALALIWRVLSGRGGGELRRT